MVFNKFTRTLVAGLLVAAVPVSASAAVRPSSAIPAASASATAAQYDDDGSFSAGWIALGAVAAIWLIALLAKDKDNDLEISRG